MKKNKVLLIGGIVLFIGALCIVAGIYYKNNEKRKELESEAVDVGIVRVADENFSSEVLNSEQMVVLEFTSNMCPPCLSMMPTLISIARDHKDTVKVVTMDTDDADSHKTKEKYGINSTPTIMIIKDGQIIKKFIGATPKENIMAALNLEE